jgi:small subunit ribosomal protein S16
MGAKGQPFYRIVVTPKESARNGRFVDLIGTYDPLKDPAEIKVDKQKAQRWLANGAKTSETVERLLKREGIEFPSADGKPRRKPAKPRVKHPKPVKPKKQKAAAAAEPAPAELPAETQAAPQPEPAEQTES